MLYETVAILTLSAVGGGAFKVPPILYKDSANEHYP